MTLSSGTRLGPYEIVAAIGAGGMGEVYRARDPRIGRDVAIKILPPAIDEGGGERLRRFEQEARAIGTLSHPNLLTIFDVGTDDATPYLVTELLEGATLREALVHGPLSPRKTIEYAVQIANGMAAAHAKGIIHRDLKPENIFITADDRVKLLDFGLAKFVAREVTPDSQTAVLVTSPGVLIGTTAYMSPEQIRGASLDPRSDIFSFGLVLHEMLAGEHPFRRDTVVETMNAILREDAPPITAAAVPPALARVVEHATAKNPSSRFESAKDVAFVLGTLTLSDEVPGRTKRTRKTEAKREIGYERITFRRGFVMSARFAPDGSILYGAAWEDKPVEVFANRAGSPEAQPLGLPNADVLSVSSSGELALSLGRHYFAGWLSVGTLARRPLSGGAPRAILEGVQDAEWTPDGRDLLILREAGNVFRIECPIGNVIYESARWIDSPRFSPRGNLIAFIEHPIWGDDAGCIVIIDSKGQQRVRSATTWPSMNGVAWTPKGDEVWTAADVTGRGREIIAVSTTGRERTVLASPSRLSFHDIDKQGNVLVTFEHARRETVVGHRDSSPERNLSWFDWSWLADITNDGKQVLLVEQGAAVRSVNTVYVRPTDGSAAVRIGEGHARGRAFSPDGKWFVMENARRELEMVPVGAGTTRLLPQPNLDPRLAWQLFPDGQRLLILDHDGLYEMALSGDGSVRRLWETKAGWPAVLSNDGKSVVASGPGDRATIYPIGGEPRPAPGCGADDVAIGWTPDDRALYVYHRGRIVAPIDKVDIETGERSRWLTIAPGDAAGILDIMPILITPDGETYAYAFRRFLSDLCVISGLS